MSNNDESVGRFGEGEEVLGEDDPRSTAREASPPRTSEPAAGQLSRVPQGHRVPRRHGARVGGQRLVAPTLIGTI
jgi:hypothetical protein